jgi:hypothetical protein
MAEFRLERFKYNWRGVWASGTSYKRDDVVRVNGKSYVCVVTHVASAAFRTDLTAILPGSIPPQPQPRWTVMTSGRSWTGEWTGGTAYNLGDVVNYNGSLWLCTVSHSASNFASDITNWEVYAQGLRFVGNWTSGNTYAPGAIVKYNGMAYKCEIAHTASGTLENNINDWSVYHEGVEIRNEWEPSTEYRLNDLVKYGSTVFRCIETHTSNNSALDDTKFEIEIFGSQYNGNWSDTTYYNVGDIVRHSGFMYYAVNNNFNSTPYNDNGNDDWILLSRSYNFVGKWSVATITVESTTGLQDGMLLSVVSGIGQFSNNTTVVSVISDTQFTISKMPLNELVEAGITGTLGEETISLDTGNSNGTVYKTGDIVLRGGNLFLALKDISGAQDDGSTLDYLDDTLWELVVPGKSFKASWIIGHLYNLGDVIYYNGSAYTCNTEHEASIINAPEDNGSGYAYWDLLIQAGRPAALKVTGDLLTYGLSRQLDNDGSTVFDESTLGDTRLPIGETEQLLSVSENLTVYWRDIVDNAETIFVATNGTDDEGYGTFEKPFKTIRYATEYVDDTFNTDTPVIIKVGVGKFEEIAPITVPANCAINGDELRSTTVLANPAFDEYQNDYQYVTAYLNHFVSILFNILTGVAITPQSGNLKSQVKVEQIASIDAQTGEIVFQPNNFPVSDLETTNLIVSLVNEFKNYVEFRILSGDNNPILSGSNVLTTNVNIINAIESITLNKNFLKAEMTSYLRNAYPQLEFNSVRINNDFWSLLRGIIRDLRFSGNYATLLAARRYANAVTGSQADNLFLVRDSTGIRDLTTGGLQGTLNPPGVFDLYQKPTGGACVSLDPGWGPDDERTWIINRSPYVQGVTNTGFGCIGMKIDGALHNGGNRSMVSNDFTQVLSDGIGVWVTNNARAELVSVFTYYCQIGYFAEDGGIIRAANGNNSYGKYGSVADGIDADEIPQNATIFNRNNEAIVVEAFAGGTSDELLLFEYANTGEQYTSATATIIGAGANASVEFTDFRDGGLFEARLTSPDGSSNKGGSGYVVKQGSAQQTLTATSTIKLSANDTTQLLSEIQGMRIIITGGTGVGQYGYVDNFSFVTKVVTVRRDSDGELGWDHIISGTPLVTDLDPTTRYRIEPRITATAPPFSTVSHNLFTNRTYVDVAYGDTTQTYTNITANSDVLWRDDNLTRIVVANTTSDTALEFTAAFVTSPAVPFNIRGRTSGTLATVTAIATNTGENIEVAVSANGTSFNIGEEIDIIYTAGSGDTFDNDPIAARFTVSRTGETYGVSLTNAGAGYSVGDVITVLGTSLGGTTPTNDLIITVTEISLDSTSSIQTFTTTGTGKTGRFVSLTSVEYSRYSDDGITWTETSLPFITTMNTLLAGNNRFIAIAAGESRVASSLTGATWSTVNLPVAQNWVHGVYGGTKFVIIGNDTDIVLSSADGVTWASGSIPNDTVGDSTISQWTAVTYGKGTYVAVSTNDRATATSTDGLTWIRHDSALPTDFAAAKIAYGNNRFVAVSSTGETAYSFNGITWYASEDLSLVVTGFQTSGLKYANGIFFLIGINAGNPGDACFTSEDGVLWNSRTLLSSQRWGALAYGVSKWVILASAASTGGINRVSFGARAKCRADVTVGVFTVIKIWDSGSGYTDLSPPVLTITDPNFITEVAYETRISNGVLSQPDFINRGAGYRTTTSAITISGNGYADIIPEDKTITLSGIINIPRPGVQIEIAGVLDLATEAPNDLYTFSGVIVEDLGDDGTGNETRLVRLTISPSLETYLNIAHGTAVTLRERFSQCRISGHDFLDIGTGNFEDTNYPDVYASGAFFVASPENEVFETNSGRVFYVSTDQDGNFRAGELFSVEQATGVVTISAQFFSLDGLSQLSLGGVRLGGSGTVVNEFSTDGTFAADSNNVIPTQRAIATFLASRLSVGGENLEVNALQAGGVILGGSDNEIDTIGGYLQIPADVNFDGSFQTDDGAGTITTEQTNISGTIVSQMLFLKKFDDTMQ